MNFGDPNSEAYQIIAELQVTIRRIVHRGLLKASGKTWYLDGCPVGMFERLVDRKENEVAIDRFDPDYHELITFASLDDLAEILEYNDDLRQLLAGLGATGTSMVDRLREIEGLRLKMAAMLPFDDEDFETLNRYRQEFRDSLQKRKKGPGEETPAPTRPVKAPAEPEPEVEVADNTESVSRSLPGGAPEFTTQAATFDELVKVVGGPAKSTEEDELTDIAEMPEEVYKTIVTAVDSPLSPAVVNGVVETGEIAAERAMAEDDNLEVLRVLHREVMAVAEGAFQGSFDHQYPVWDALRTSGWYDIKKAELSLTPVELFYTVAEKARAMEQDGSSVDEIKLHLEAKEFTKLLLSLRDMFLRHNL